MLPELLNIHVALSYTLLPVETVLFMVFKVLYAVYDIFKVTEHYAVKYLVNGKVISDPGSKR
jgi:hypothetical protein